VKKISQENNFIYLFFALILFLFSSALVHQLQTSLLNGIHQIIVVAVFLIGVHSLKANRSWLWAVYLMSIILGTLFVSKYFFTNNIFLDYIHLVILLLFFIGSFMLSYKQIIMSRTIGQNMLIGSIVLYLLLGLIWSMFYLLLLVTFPDAFHGIISQDWRENLPRLLYFSFVTLTTLGYGDVTPNGTVTEFFTYTEAIAGVFYIAIIVSSLVSARLAVLKK